MNIIDHIDFSEIYNVIKKTHFKQFDTKEEYIEELVSMDIDPSFVDDLYKFFDYDFSSDNIEWTSGENSSDYDVLRDVIKTKTIEFEMSIGGNNANESTNYNEWGYGYIFKIDLDFEMFIGYREENYS